MTHNKTHVATPLFTFLLRLNSSLFTANLWEIHYKNQTRKLRKQIDEAAEKTRCAIAGERKQQQLEKTAPGECVREETIVAVDCWRRWRRANQITVYRSSRLDHMHLFVNKVQEEEKLMQFYYVFNLLRVKPMEFSYGKEEIITHEERVVVVRGPRVHSTNALPWTPAVQRPLYLYLEVQFFFFLKSFGNGDRRAYTNTLARVTCHVCQRGETSKCNLFLYICTDLTEISSRIHDVMYDNNKALMYKRNQDFWQWEHETHFVLVKCGEQCLIN